MPEEREPDRVRAEGSALVTVGPPGARPLVVLDPTGSAKHGELPGTWRPLTDDHQVFWCRMPVEGSIEAGARALAEDRGSTHYSDIVASGPHAGDALNLADRYQATVRSVLLVDPAAEGLLSPGDATQADEKWLSQHGNRVAMLRDAGIDIEIIAHSTDDPEDRLPAPLPLGHPRVVEAVRKALNGLPAVRRPAL